MPSEINEIKKMKVFPKGQVVIPVSLRKKYDIQIGDHVEVIPANNGILLKPYLKVKHPESLTDSLFGIFRQYARKKQHADKIAVEKATENGFIDGWRK
ncbi:MAG: AbrB/MazE/SpoVT family DNA-binding domain-containing protein [Desulfobacterales bacterium]|nr:AbrB/MazE/SpoVT family DNA-binding domain-containing protein [Desulfobacterales bacterium]